MITRRKFISGTAAATNLTMNNNTAISHYPSMQIGLLLDELNAAGLAENTVVVLWGDHDWNLGEHGLWCKHCNFNTSLNAPLMFRVPGLTNGKTNSSITEFIDIYPTLCDLAGLPPPSHLEGQSLVKRLKKPEKQEKDFAVSKFNNGITLIEDKMFYTEWIDKNDSVISRMLYDHASDQDENINISEEPRNADLVGALGVRLREKRGISFLGTDSQ